MTAGRTVDEFVWLTALAHDNGWVNQEFETGGFDDLAWRRA
jgi:hypothetical protein